MNIIEIIKQVISSWQVIAVTLVILLYIYIVNHAAKSYHRPRAVKKIKEKKQKPPAPVPTPDEEQGGGNSNDELGLEEA